MPMAPSRPRHTAQVSALLLVLASLATLGFPGCPSNDLSSDGTSNPTAMRMTNLWPNDDGRYWIYDMRQQMLEYAQIEFLPLDQVPPAITAADAKHLLGEAVTPVGAEGRYGYMLDFQGEMTTQSGVTAQNLHETFPYTGGLAGAPARGEFVAGFLARLAEARPDLRARIEARTGRLAAPSAAKGGLLRLPYFIHGYAWEKTSTYIGTYGDVDTLLAWKFLESNIRPGHEFSHQLVPALADDIWLRGLVNREVKVSLPNHNSANGLEVIYLIDYGVGYSTDAMGNPVGTYRAFDYGSVTYVPGVGPVNDYERVQGVIAKTTTLGVAHMRMNLMETGIRPSLATSAAAR